MPPLSLRCDSPVEPRRLTLHEDRLVVETRDMIVGTWSVQRTFFLDEIVLVLRYRRPTLFYLLWLVFALPIAFVGVGVLRGGGVFILIGGLTVLLAMVAGLRPRPWISVIARDGQHVDARMDRPLLAPGARRRFYATLFTALGLELPADLRS